MQKGKSTSASTTSHIEPAAHRFLMKVLAWWNTAIRPRFSLILLIFLLVVVAGLSAIYHSTQRQSRVAAGFAAIQDANNSTELLDLAKRHAGTSVGAVASLAAAKALFGEGKYDQASNQYESFCRDYSSSPQLLAGQLGKAYALEAARKLAPAEKNFIAIAESSKDPDIIAEAYLGAGRCARAQDKLAEAEKWYKTAASSGCSTALKDKAMTALKDNAAAASPALAQAKPDHPEAAAAPAQ